MDDMGKKIYNLRTAQGMTLEELGNKVGVGKSTVRKWENGLIGNMRRDKVVKVAKALGTTPAYLLGWDNEEDCADPLLPLSREEESIIRNYRASDESTQLAVCAVLGVKKDVGCLDSRRNA